jgi:hypothetical protein
MPKLVRAQTNFVAGELSPLMAGRSDTQQYQNGASRLLNFAPLAQGGVRTRPGLKYLATLPQTPVMLKGFTFSNQQRYVFAFSNARVDIYFADGTLATTLTSCPWTSAMLNRLVLTIEGDTTIITHPDMATRRLVRTGLSSFVLSLFAFEVGSSTGQTYQPYYKFADPAMTLGVSAISGTGVTLVLSSPGIFTAQHVGTIVRYAKKEILITGVTNATSATGNILQTLPTGAATTDWDEQTFSAVRGYPTSAIFFDNRLVFGGSKSLPSGFWASKIGAFFNFDLGASLDNEAIWDNVAGPRVAEIRAMTNVQQLLLFSDTSLVLMPTGLTRPFTPKNLYFREQSPYGTNYTAPLPFDGGVIFVQGTGTSIRAALWEDTQQAFSAGSLSLLADHLIRQPVSMAVLHGTATRPEQYALLVNTDGTMAIYHSARDQNIAAWAEWQTEGLFKSVCTAGDEAFVAVLREGGTFLEKFSDSSLLDASELVSAASPRHFPGFAHLAGEEVEVVSRGHYLGRHEVSGGGEIVLPDSSPDVEEIEAGYWTAPLLRPLPVDVELRDGAARARQKRLVRTFLLTDRSGAFMVDGRTVLLDFQGDDYDSQANTKTGLVEFRLLGYDPACLFDLLVSTPAQATILSLIREVQVNN